MPRINDRFLDCVFYLYRNIEAAKKGENLGGTGFWVAYIPEETASFYIFAVSNKHVIADAPVIRVNRVDGNVEGFEIEPHEWHFDGNDDLAIAHVQAVDPAVHRIVALPMGMFATPDRMREYDLGPGDEVFMVGRFIRHDGKTTNIPSVRFGSLSIPLARLDHPSYGTQESFGVEMRSMAGYSGSPVFIWPSQWNMNSGSVTIGTGVLFLLGIDWGHIVDPIEVEQGMVSAATQASAPMRQISYVRASTGMNGVVPAWRLARLIETSPWAEGMKREAKAEAERLRVEGPAVDSASAPSPEVGEANPDHKEDFTSLLNAAAKTKPQDD